MPADRRVWLLSVIYRPMWEKCLAKFWGSGESPHGEIAQIPESVVYPSLLLYNDLITDSFNLLTFKLSHAIHARLCLLIKTQSCYKLCDNDHS